MSNFYHSWEDLENSSDCAEKSLDCVDNTVHGRGSDSMQAAVSATAETAESLGAPPELVDLLRKKESLESKLKGFAGDAEQQEFDDERRRKCFPVKVHTKETRIEEKRIKRHEDAQNLTKKRSQQKIEYNRKKQSEREAIQRELKKRSIIRARELKRVDELERIKRIDRIQRNNRKNKEQEIAEQKCRLALNRLNLKKRQAEQLILEADFLSKEVLKKKKTEAVLSQRKQELLEDIKRRREIQERFTMRTEIAKRQLLEENRKKARHEQRLAQRRDERMRDRAKEQRQLDKRFL